MKYERILPNFSEFSGGRAWSINLAITILEEWAFMWQWDSYWKLHLAKFRVFSSSILSRTVAGREKGARKMGAFIGRRLMIIWYRGCSMRQGLGRRIKSVRQANPITLHLKLHVPSAPSLPPDSVIEQIQWRGVLRHSHQTQHFWALFIVENMLRNIHLIHHHKFRCCESERSSVYFLPNANRPKFYWIDKIFIVRLVKSDPICV